jgi:hypothetical protein
MDDAAFAPVAPFGPAGSPPSPNPFDAPSLSSTPAHDPQEWIWRVLLVGIGAFMILRLVVLSKQVAEATKAARAAAGALQLSDERKVGAADGKPIVIYAVRVRADLSREAVRVVPIQSQNRDEFAVPLVMAPTPSSEILLADVKLGRTRHLLVDGRAWGCRPHDWARRDTYEEMNGLHCIWLVGATLPASFPLGAPVEGGAGEALNLGRAGDAVNEDGVVKCYALGLS